MLRYYIALAKCNEPTGRLNKYAQHEMCRHFVDSRSDNMYLLITYDVVCT